MKNDYDLTATGFAICYLSVSGGNSDTDEIIDALTGILWDEEYAGDLRRRVDDIMEQG